MYKNLIFTAFIFISCIDFDIDAPYEDINGIYLEHIKSYDFSGEKIAIDNEKGYLLNGTDIVCYDFADVYGIDTVSSYQSVYPKPDFAISDDHAFIVSQNFGLEIVDFRQTTPQLSGFFRIYGPIQSIALANNNAYIAGLAELHTIDVSDVVNPVSIAEYTFDDSIVHFEVESDYLYVLFSEGTFQIIDISSPTNPQLIAEHQLSDTLDNAYYFVKHNEYLYVTRGYGIDTYEIQGNGTLDYQNTLSFLRKVDFLSIYDEYGLCFHRQFGLLYLLNLSYPSRPCISESREPGGIMWHGIIKNQYIYFLHLNLSILEIKEIEP